MTDSWSAAMVQALAEMPAITKAQNATVPMKGGGSYSYTYADLATIVDAIKPVLSKHGLAVVQDVTDLGHSTVGVSTIVIHTSGEQRTFGPLPMNAAGTPQQLGSAITYARRYALLAALGIATEDDDGKAASTPAPQPEPTYSAAALKLFERVKATKGTHVEPMVREFAAENGRTLSVAAFDQDPTWAEQVTALLDKETK